MIHYGNTTQNIIYLRNCSTPKSEAFNLFYGGTFSELTTQSFAMIISTLAHTHTAIWFEIVNFEV
jgi:hypothetical protein